MAAFSSYRNYDPYDDMRKRLYEQQEFYDRRMREMRDMMQQQMYPMYQTTGADWSTGTSTTSTSVVTTNPSMKDKRMCHRCGRIGDVGSYCVCEPEPTRNYQSTYKATFVSTEDVKCPSCGERAHQKRLSKGQDCERTKGLLVRKRIQNFRKLYWHRRAKNPELFETKHD